MPNASNLVAETAPASTILLVDDDAAVRLVIADFLEDFGYHVLQAGSGRQALDLLESNPGVRLLITDVRMPEMSGLELAEAATIRNPELKIILVSGHHAAPRVERRQLRKPFRMNELRAAILAELGE